MKRFIIFLVLGFPVITQAQSLSIKQLWAAAEQSMLLQQNRLKAKVLEQELKEVKSDRLPVVYIDANLQRNLIIPITPVPSIAFDPNAQEGAITPLKFATKWSSKAGLQLEWNIFDPKRRIDYAVKTQEIEKSNIEVGRAKQQWIQEATKAYASIVLASEQYRFAKEDSAAYRAILDLTKLRYDAGRESNSTYLLAQQEFERKRIQLYESWSVLREVDLELRNYIDLDTVQALTSSMEEINALAIPLENYTLKSLEVDKSIAGLEAQRIRKQLLPTLTLNSYLGQQYFDNELRLWEGEQWYGNSYVNLALRIPLSGYLVAQTSIKKSTLQEEVIKKEILAESRSYSIQQQQKAVKVRAAQQKISSFQLIEKLAQEEYDLQNTTYKAGRSLLANYHESGMAYRKAKQDLWQAKYDLLLLLLEI